MKIAVKIAFMAAATIPAAASAQEAGRMLSLDEAIAVTLTENPALKAAAYEERAAQQQRRAAIGLRITAASVSMEPTIPPRSARVQPKGASG